MTQTGFVFRSLFCILATAVVLGTVLVGCVKTDKCAEAVATNESLENKDYQAVIKACKADFAASQRVSSALALATAHGELGDWPALSQLQSSLDQPVLQADVMMVAAKYHRRAGQADQAQKNHLAAIDVYRKFDRPAELGRALNHAFWIVWRNSDHKAGLNFAAEALEVAQRSNNANHEISALSNLIKVFQEVGSLGAAQYALNRQRALLKEHANLGQKIDADINQGLVYVDEKKNALAALSFSKALKQASGIGSARAMRGLYLNLVAANLELGRLEQAEENLERAWGHANSDGSAQFALDYFQAKLHHGKHEFELAEKSIAKSLADSSKPAVWNWELLYLAGRIAHDLGETRRAIDYFKSAIAESDRLRNAIGFNDLKAHLLSRKREPYEALFLSYLDEGDTQSAFSIAEQAKAKSFVEAYLQNQENSLPGTEGDAGREFNIDAESQRIDDLLQHLRLMQSSPAVIPRSAPELLPALAREQVLSFFVARERIFSISVINGAIAINELGIDYGTLQKWVRAYQATPSNSKLLAQLGAALLANLDLNHPSKHLYVSPDDIISDLVFASLKVNNRFLVEMKSISLIPSASSLFEIRADDSHANSKRSLILGNPQNDLPAAQVEMHDVARRLNTQAITGKAAESSVVLAANGLRVLHLATHSGVNHLGPWLRFADGDVAAKRLAQRNITARMVVLASCSSVAKEGKNLWGSLGGIFLSNGSPSVLVTQWSVKDEITREVVSQFYQHFNAGKTPAESLALVQRDAIRRNVATSDWGAYVLLGE